MIEFSCGLAPIANPRTPVELFELVWRGRRSRDNHYVIEMWFGRARGLVVRGHGPLPPRLATQAIHARMSCMRNAGSLRAAGRPAVGGGFVAATALATRTVAEAATAAAAAARASATAAAVASGDRGRVGGGCGRSSGGGAQASHASPAMPKRSQCHRSRVAGGGGGGAPGSTTKSTAAAAASASSGRASGGGPTSRATTL